jgi:hypothetical protein
VQKITDAGDVLSGVNIFSTVPEKLVTSPDALRTKLKSRGPSKQEVSSDIEWLIYKTV